MRAFNQTVFSGYRFHQLLYRQICLYGYDLLLIFYYLQQFKKSWLFMADGKPIQAVTGRSQNRKGGYGISRGSRQNHQLVQ